MNKNSGSDQYSGQVLVIAPDKLDIEIGEWYYGASCRYCEHLALFMHDGSKGAVRISGTVPFKFYYGCPNCGKPMVFLPSAVRPYEATGSAEDPKMVPREYRRRGSIS